MAIVFCMPMSLTICAVGNLPFVPGWFKFNFTLVKVFDIEDRLIDECRFEIDKKIESGSFVRYCVIFQTFATLCPSFSISALMWSGIME
jgi:hypothetical protein